MGSKSPSATSRLHLIRWSSVVRLSADCVEKLRRPVRGGLLRKSDLSDRARIDERDQGKGWGTLEKVRRVASVEFFNTIGQQRTFDRCATPPLQLIRSPQVFQLRRHSPAVQIQPLSCESIHVD